MFGRIMDTLDDWTGYNRSAVRALLVILAAPVLVFGSIVAFDKLSEPEPTPCDATCEADLNQYIDTTVDRILTDMNRHADDILREAERRQQEQEQRDRR